MSKLTLSVIMPSYQEVDNIINLLPRLTSVLKSMQIAFEILVIDRMVSNDDTKKICKDNVCKYINRRGGDNYADAVRTGISMAAGKYVLFMDADGSHPPEFIPTMFKHIGCHDVVIASRYVSNGDTENSFILILLSRILNYTYSLLLSLPCKDVSNSFKMYHRTQINGIHLECSNFDVVEELLYKLYNANKIMRIKEVPFVFKKRLHGKTKRNLLLFIFSYIVTIIKLRKMN